MKSLELDGHGLSLDQLSVFLAGGVEVSAAAEARDRVQASAAFCAERAQEDEAHYGINTGFGTFATTRIPNDSLEKLQKNLLRSHATGMGDPLPDDIVRLMMLLRVNSLLQGYSGISLGLVDRLLDFVNRGVVPVVPMYGSVGASGDLAPLAHMALPLIGEGQAKVGGKAMDGAAALSAIGLEPLGLGPKEGLALINGTQLMSAYAVREMLRARSYLKASMIAAAMSVEAYHATDKMFDARIHELKRHPGEQRVAAGFRRLLAGSEIVQSHADCGRVQDPYSFRCVPQVLGAVCDTMLWVEQWVDREINAVTDNPLVFKDDGDIVSGGNFHGEHMALALDALANAVAEIGNIAERRIDKLLDNDTEHLPKCLVAEPGLNSGLMVSQYLAASLVSENKVYAHPASVDSVPTSAGFEDHVSMGSISAFKLTRIVDNIARIVSVELLCAAQGMDYTRPPKGGEGSEIAYAAVRKIVPFIKEDQVLSGHLEKLEALVRDFSLVSAVEKKVGDLLSEDAS